jgi:signal transduction histidine kinase
LRRLPSIGLRARFVAALIATAAATLAVAALTLLSPLEHRLRNDELRFLTENTLAAVPALHDIEGGQLVPNSRQLRSFARHLERRTGARVVLFDQAGQVLVDSDPDAARAEQGPFDDVSRALQTGRRVRGIREAGPGGEARVALPVDLGGQAVVIALRHSLEQTHSAVRVVRRAFLVAAIVGLGIAVLLGITLATALLRRLRRLRDAARALAEEGLHHDLPPEPARDEVGELARALSAMRERLHREEEVRRAFIATASHELRTPLASLDAMLELVDDDLRAEPADLGDAGPRVWAAREQTRRLIALANDLLELTRLDTGFELRKEPVELREICRAVAAELAIRAEELQVPLELDGQRTPCWVAGDPDSIARIARILLDNALRFSPEGRPVTIAVSCADGSGIVAVEDAGPGVRPDERELVFERFKRGTGAGSEGGFGLGLAIGSELAERMGGALHLADADRGARFVLRLPSVASPAAGEEAHDRR